MLMAYRRLDVIEIAELVRLLRSGESDRTIARVLGHNRRTVIRYRTWAREQGLLEGEMPASSALHRLLAETFTPPPPPQQTSSVGSYAEEIKELRTRGMEIAAIRGRLEERHGHPVSYSAVWRLVQHFEPTRSEPVVRLEVRPGSEAQVDFGYAGRHLDPTDQTLRRAWVFVMLLSWSRHLYAEVVFDQRIETWLLCHVHAFSFFSGVPARIVSDNLKAAVTRASFTGDPVLQRSYRECAEHYGFLIDPTRPRSPQLKGKVEQGGVHYVARNFLAGRDPMALDALNRALRTWCIEIAGERIHGTTKERPMSRFTTTEQAMLRSLPQRPYDPASWKQVRVYRDCYVTFEGSHYSAPHRLVGQPLWVRGGARIVELYTTDHQLVATHDRARQRGERQTHLDHLPPTKLPGLVLSRASVQLRAEAIGPATLRAVQHLLAHQPEDRLRSAGRIVQLAEGYGALRLEAACRRAEHFGEVDVPTVKRILQAGQEGAPLPGEAGVRAANEPPRYTFVRQASDFAKQLLGGAR
jgi:transposase